MEMNLAQRLAGRTASIRCSSGAVLTGRLESSLAVPGLRLNLGRWQWVRVVNGDGEPCGDITSIQTVDDPEEDMYEIRRDEAKDGDWAFVGGRRYEIVDADPVGGYRIRTPEGVATVTPCLVDRFLRPKPPLPDKPGLYQDSQDPSMLWKIYLGRDGLDAVSIGQIDAPTGVVRHLANAAHADYLRTLAPFTPVCLEGGGREEGFSSRPSHAGCRTPTRPVAQPCQ